MLPLTSCTLWMSTSSEDSNCFSSLYNKRCHQVQQANYENTQLSSCATSEAVYFTPSNMRRSSKKEVKRYTSIFRNFSLHSFQNPLLYKLHIYFIVWELNLSFIWRTTVSSNGMGAYSRRHKTEVSWNNGLYFSDMQMGWLITTSACWAVFL